MKDHREPILRTRVSPAAQRNSDAVVDSLRSGVLWSHGRQAFQARIDRPRAVAAADAGDGGTSRTTARDRLVVSQLNGRRYRPLFSVDADGNVRMRGDIRAVAPELQ